MVAPVWCPTGWNFGIIFPGYLADVIEVEGLEPMLHFKSHSRDMELWCTEADLAQVELHGIE